MRAPWRSFALVGLAVTLGLAAPVRAQDPNRPSGTAGTTLAGDPAPVPGDPSVPADDPPPADPNAGRGGIVDGSRSGGDPLAANGLGGALCRSDRLAGRLSPAAADNCVTAGVTAAPAPVTHYGFDVHIDTGVLGVSGRTFAAAVQTLLLTPLWTLLLWVVQSVFALLEWSYAIDLLDPATVGTIADALQRGRELFTQPWLALALAVAAVALVYHAVVRRAMAESAGRAVALLVMIVLGLGVVASPAGTVGEANALVQDASLGTVAAVSANDPVRAEASFADGLRGVFATVVEGPWCYMEFGDVEWCRDPARRDDRLVEAARRSAGGGSGSLRCGPPTCRQGGDGDRPGVLVARARTNGDLFLAFAANGDERNSINDEDSLFRALCGADSDDDCTGPTAEQARWRTESGTWPRAGGLALIAVGVAGMVALLGFLALRLLGAAILAVLCLLLAPVAVIAPALGDGGRNAFRAWGMRLLGALVGKLLYSAFLGVVLLTLQVLQGMGALGWWTQWLLVAAFWWIVFAHRHRVLEYATLGHAATGARTMSTTARLITAQRLATVARDAATPGRLVARRSTRTTRDAAAETRRRLRAQSDSRRTMAASRPADSGQRPHEHRDPTAARPESATAPDVYATRLAAHDAGEREARRHRAPHAEARAERLELRRARIAERIEQARSAGDVKSVARLRDRDRRLAAEIATQRRIAAGPGDEPAAATGLVGRSPGHPGARAAWLDHQTTLRRGVSPGPRSDPAAYRDYVRLAALVGVGEHDYTALAPGPQRRVRLDVDRALRTRAQAPGGVPAPGDATRQRPDLELARPRAPEDIARPRRSALERQFDVDDGPHRRPRRGEDGW